MRAVSVPFSPARPSRLKNEPGILPAAYIRSSTSTVSGRKSTSRWLPAVAVDKTTVSPWRTTTEPEACLASFPVSKEISLPAISTDTVVTASSVMQLSFLARIVGNRRAVFSSLSAVSDSQCRIAVCSGSGVQPAQDRGAREAPLPADLAAGQLAGLGELEDGVLLGL